MRSHGYEYYSFLSSGLCCMTHNVSHNLATDCSETQAAQARAWLLRYFAVSILRSMKMTSRSTQDDGAVQPLGDTFRIARRPTRVSEASFCTASQQSLCSSFVKPVRIPSVFYTCWCSFGDQYRAYLRGQLTIHKNNIAVNRIWAGCDHLIHYTQRLEVCATIAP